MRDFFLFFAGDGLRREKMMVPITSTWNRGGRACLRVVDPVPCTVVSASRDVEVGK